jgi:long-chain acyl-CoA synthetase
VTIPQVREALGLDQAKYFYSGSAPISREVVEYFASLNMPIYEGFGMSECGGGYSLTTHSAWKIGYCGRPFPGIYRIEQLIIQIQVKSTSSRTYRNTHQDSPRDW